MPRLIDANEILKSEHQHYDYMSDEYYVTVRDIENVQPVDAVPVRHGHYEGMLFCSECHQKYYDEIQEYCGDDVPKYCPNCGADMREESR